MDQDLKQRLVGAVVITSLAAIFVPMLFDDPIDETGEMISELKIPDAPANLTNPDVANLPKSIDDVIKLPEPEIEKQVTEVKSIENKPAMVRWFVQVGIFGQESNAKSLQNQIRKQGFPVIITTVSGENGLLYRVKVGPELSKIRAEKMKLDVDKLNKIKGILISEE